MLYVGMALAAGWLAVLIVVVGVCRASATADRAGEPVAAQATRPAPPVPAVARAAAAAARVGLLGSS